jgi:hypothetical protein
LTNKEKMEVWQRLKLVITFHSPAEQMLASHSFLFLLVPTEHGKCSSGSTVIVCAHLSFETTFDVDYLNQ